MLKTEAQSSTNKELNATLFQTQGKTVRKAEIKWRFRSGKPLARERFTYFIHKNVTWLFPIARFNAPSDFSLEENHKASVATICEPLLSSSFQPRVRLFYRHKHSKNILRLFILPLPHRVSPTRVSQIKMIIGSNLST